MTVAPPAAARTPICSLSRIKKHFDGTQALAGIDLDLYPGEVHAIVGSNGAGKSTLMNILAGAVQPDEGEIVVRDRLVHFGTVKDASREGIAIVFQELSLFPSLSVVANLFSLRELSRFGILRQREMRRRARPVLEQIGLDVELSTPVHALSLGKRQEVEIARALLSSPDVLILDEPTSALNAVEVDRLMEVIRGLRQRGVAVVYISHRLEEVFAIADVITVVRAGEIVQTMLSSETSINEVVYAMTGRAPDAIEVSRPPVSSTTPESSLQLLGVTVKGELEAVSLMARPGEVVGLAGLEGAGVQTILDVLFGRRRPDSGAVVIPGGKRPPRSIPRAVQAGVGYVPADRRSEGLMMDQSVHANLSHVVAGALRRAGFLLDKRRLRKQADAIGQRLQITMASAASPVSTLSGGNQQKVVFGKWMQSRPSIILLNDPTRGVDIGAKAELYEAIRELVEEGTIILFVSSDLLEYRIVCDRAVVLYQGRLAGELERERLTEHALLEAINVGRVEAATVPAS
ncbi:MAG TPA: sugar ABC transporter ATP-binding protein [Gaiellaceae bacterium]|nr:sugar ABC transporter ATP-binding protein [Gaiellaceae bacterium]